MYNTIKECIQRTRRMEDNYSMVKDIIDSFHFSPGTKIKLHYVVRIGRSPYIKKTRTVTVVKEYPTWILVDFGKYYGTINKVDVLIDNQRISLWWNKGGLYFGFRYTRRWMAWQVCW